MNLFDRENIVGFSKIKKSLIKSDDWAFAKKGIDYESGKRIVDKAWPDKKTELLIRNIADKDNTIFLTVPSTSRQNIIPVCLAEKISLGTGLPFEIGDYYYNVLHEKEIKNVSRLDKPFFIRDYQAISQEAIQDKFKGKSVIVVDDIFTTGGSVKWFCNSLRESGVKPSFAVALMGDRRLLRSS